MNLSPEYLQALEAESSVVVLLDPAGVIRYVNQAWSTHALRDGAPAYAQPSPLLGRRYLEFVSGDLRRPVSDAFERARSLGPGVKAVYLEGECNTPERWRRLTTRIGCLWPKGTPASQAFIVHHELHDKGNLAERYPPSALSPELFRAATGIITQCGCCRRVRHPVNGEWLMSTQLLQRSDDRTSHSLCELCVETYYGDPLIA